VALRNIFKGIKKQFLYNDCYDLPIYNFDMVFKSKDFRFLVVGYDGYNDVGIPIGAGERWKAIFDQWVVLSDSNTLMYYYQLLSEVAYLETRYTVSKILIYEMHTQDMNEKTLDMFIEALKDWRYFYNKDNDKEKEIERLIAINKGSQNKLGIKKSELENMQKEHSESEKTLVGQAVVLEQITGKNNIDIKKISVAKWLEIGKIANRINEQRERNGRK